VSRYRFVDVEKANYPICTLCRVLEVSRAGYYAWAGREPSVRARDDAVLTEQIGKIHEASRGTYGAPRVHAELAENGVHVGRKRVARLMRTAGLSGQRRRRRARTTVVDRGAAVAPNLVARQFTVAAPNRLWVGDMTYVPTWEGWLYVAVLLDCYARRVIGWSMADNLRTDLPLAALNMALSQRRPEPGQLVHHTDRGCQYTSSAYQDVLAAHGVIASMSRPGDPIDNAVAESFFASLKAELIDRQPWPTRRAALQAIFEWIEVYYNRRRRHSSIGYMSPVMFEERLTRSVAA
jgi:putative transposase